MKQTVQLCKLAGKYWTFQGRSQTCLFESPGLTSMLFPHEWLNALYAYATQALKWFARFQYLFNCLDKGRNRAGERRWRIHKIFFHEYWARIVQRSVGHVQVVAYEAKDVIDLIIIRDNGLLHLISHFPFP